ncbi:MAG TPA: XrtA/PEP-CTERM system histidine kinase PrsK [Rhodocyclaceae bacterium]|nr:XrtA/PEP-CTERM system histidine kinase PrsK [Rhodocyclaceae bacterium]
MDAHVTQIHFWAYGAAAIVFGVFALYLGLGWRGGRLGARLLTAVALSAIWAALACMEATAWSGTFIALLAQLFDWARLAAWSVFLVGLLAVAAPSATSVERLRGLKRLGGLIFGLALLSALFGDQLNITARWQIFVTLVLSIWLLALIEQVYRNFPAGSRWGIKPLSVGLAGIFAFDLYLYADAFLFGRVDMEVASIRGVVHALATPLVAMSAVRSRDWTFRITVSRDLIFHTTALAVSGIYLLLIAAAGYYVRWFGGAWGPAMQTALLFCGLLLLVLLVFSGSFRARLRVWLNKHFFAYRYDYRHAWLKFTQALSSPVMGQTLEQSVIGALADLVESPSGVLWLQDADGIYHPCAQINRPPMQGAEPAEGPFCQLLHQRGWIFNLEEWRSRPERYEALTGEASRSIPAWLSECADAWLVVPLMSGSEMTGFVVLATARVPVEVNWEVLDLLKTAGRQAASYLAQARALAALLEAQKFDSFNRMSAFIVHDLKNLVAQMSLMLKNADRHKNNPEFQADMLLTVENVAERMRGLMNQLQNKSPIEQKRAVDIAALCATLVQAKHSSGPQLRLCVNEAAKTNVHVFAHAERLERIIGHVVQNAIEATPEHGNVEIAVDQEDGKVRVDVCDTGCGMSAEFVRERLFRPFQTSKHNGMGIGAYEVQQYVQELGGKITVDSELGRGTRFTILLPLSDRVERATA